MQSSFPGRLLRLLLLPSTIGLRPSIVSKVRFGVLPLISGLPLLSQHDHLLKDRCGSRKGSLHRDSVDGRLPTIRRVRQQHCRLLVLSQHNAFQNALSHQAGEPMSHRIHFLSSDKYEGLKLLVRVYCSVLSDRHVIGGKLIPLPTCCRKCE